MRTVPVIVDSCLRVEELAWCAGFLDGEGCFYGWAVARPDKTPAFKVMIEASQVGRRAPLDRLQQTLGGNVHERHYPCRYSRPLYRWAVWGARDCMRVLDLIGQNLCVKNEDARLLRRYMRTFGQRRQLTSWLIEHRLYLLDKMKDHRHA